MAFMLVWLRLSTNRQLDWYRNSSHQSKDIAHVQKTLAQRMADKVRDPAARPSSHTGSPSLVHCARCVSSLEDGLFPTWHAPAIWGCTSKR